MCAIRIHRRRRGIALDMGAGDHDRQSKNPGPARSSSCVRHGAAHLGAVLNGSVRRIAQAARCHRGAGSLRATAVLPLRPARPTRQSGSRMTRRAWPERLVPPSDAGRLVCREWPPACPPRGHIIATPFDADCALRHGGQHIAGFDRRRWHVGTPQPVQPGHGQKGATGHDHRPAFSTLSAHCRETPPHVRSGRTTFNCARRRRLDVPYNRTVRQFLQRADSSGDTKASRTSSRGRKQSSNSPLGLIDRHILHRMYRNVDTTGQQAALRSPW